MGKQRKVNIIQTGIKYLNFAKYACLLMVVIFMGYVGFMMAITKLSYITLINENPILLAGFINCVANLVLYGSLAKDIKCLNEGKDYIKVQTKLIMDGLIFACLFNLPGLITLVLGCRKCFSWTIETIDQCKQCIAYHKGYFSGYALGFAGLILWCYWIALSFR